MTPPTEEQVRERARELWERAGRPEGRDEEFWYGAEKELHEMQGMREEAQKSPSEVLPG